MVTLCALSVDGHGLPNDVHRLHLLSLDLDESSHLVIEVDAHGQGLRQGLLLPILRKFVRETREAQAWMPEQNKNKRNNKVR